MSSDSSGAKLDEIVAEYLRAEEAGAAPSQSDVISAYPDLADSLRSFFSNHARLKATATEDATIPPSALDGDATLPERDSSESPTMAPNSLASETATIPPGSATAELVPIGTKVRYFGDYELLEEIARGGMGVVYKARQVSLNRVVALKMILAGQLAGDEDVQRFHAEAEAAANLDHPGIVPIYEIGAHEGRHYFSMGFVEGESLKDKITDGPLPAKEAAEHTKKVAEAIAFAHERGVIHRDLKPANVLLDRNGEAKVTDFGLAKKVEGDSDLTATGQILGTPSFMPPEQASGKLDEVAQRADVYSLGAVLYALVTARPPFQADNPLDTLMQVLDREPVSTRALNPNVPRDLETICLKCLQKEQHHRYSSAKELVGDLERFLNHEPILARRTSLANRFCHWYLRRSRLVAAGYAMFTHVMAIVNLPLSWLLHLSFGNAGAASVALPGTLAMLAVGGLGLWWSILTLRGGNLALWLNLALFGLLIVSSAVQLSLLPVWSPQAISPRLVSFLYAFVGFLLHVNAVIGSVTKRDETLQLL